MKKMKPKKSTRTQNAVKPYHLKSGSNRCFVRRSSLAAIEPGSRSVKWSTTVDFATPMKGLKAIPSLSWIKSPCHCRSGTRLSGHHTPESSAQRCGPGPRGNWGTGDTAAGGRGVLHDIVACDAAFLRDYRTRAAVTGNHCMVTSQN